MSATEWSVYFHDPETSTAPTHLCSFSGMEQFKKYWDAMDIPAMRRGATLCVMKREHPPHLVTGSGVWCGVESINPTSEAFTSCITSLVDGNALSANALPHLRGVVLAKESSSEMVLSVWCGDAKTMPDDASAAIGAMLRKKFHCPVEPTFTVHGGGSWFKNNTSMGARNTGGNASSTKANYGQSPKLPIKGERIPSLPDEAADRVTADNQGIGGIGAKTAIMMQGRWAIWYDYSKTGMTEDEYADSLRMLSGFKTVEEFHQYWDTIDLQRLKYSANIRIFRAGILPFWTVHRNVHGGQFSIRLQGSDEGRAQAFENIMEMMVNHQFADCAKLNGVCFGKRGEKQHIKIWTSTTELEVQAITDQLHDLCESLGARHMKITFISFKDLHAEKVSNIEASNDQTPVDEEQREAALKPIVKSASAISSGSRAPAPGVPIPFVIALALTYLLGLLVNDAVFDAAPLPISRAYNCAILDSITRFPHMLRIVCPATIVLGFLVYRLGFMQTPQLSQHVDAASLILLGVGGAVAFYHTMTLARSMCAVDLNVDNMAAVQDMRAQMVPWHVFLGGALAVTLVLQLGGMWAEARN